MTINPFEIAVTILSYALSAGLFVAAGFAMRAGLIRVFPMPGSPRSLGWGIFWAIVGFVGLVLSYAWLAVIAYWWALLISLIAGAVFAVRGHWYWTYTDWRQWIAPVFGVAVAIISLVGLIALLVSAVAPYMGDIRGFEFEIGDANSTPVSTQAPVSTPVSTQAPVSTPVSTQAPVSTPVSNGGELCTMETVDAQNGFAVPVWSAEYGDASRSGDEEGDSYPLYPYSAYLAVAADFNGIQDAVHMVWSQASMEHAFTFEDAEVIPAVYGQDLGVIWGDAQLLAAYKAAVQNRSSLPLYCWTVMPDGTLTAGINR